MIKFFRTILVVASVLYAGLTFALTSNYDVNDIPKLEQQPQHAKVAKRVGDLFSRSHYKYIPLNDELSKKIFARYLKQLDYNKQIFTQSDIDLLSKNEYLLDDNLKTGKLANAYEIYQLNLLRRFQRFSYALSLLETPITFTAKEEYQLDRTEMPWPADKAELDELWRKKVKSDALLLKLNGKKWDEIKEVLSKRYKSAIEHLVLTESEDVFHSFMNAYANTIEPHTNYFTFKEAKSFRNEMDLALEGIGAVLQLDDDYTVVKSLVPGGPAARSKQIFADDLIIGVGQAGEKIIDVVGWRLNDIVKLIKGPKGTIVQLQLVSSKSGANSRIIEITREKIHLEEREAKASVEIIDDKKVGVISISTFYNKLSEDVFNHLSELKEDNVSGIVIDLRNNGGGSLREAILLTGFFIKTGPIVQVRDSRNQIMSESNDSKDIVYDGPLTILINRNSASASEIFAAALQDYGRAVVIGEQSFGKGTVQQLRPIERFYDDEDEKIGSVKFTTAKFYRINGGSTQHKGVVPDILFPTPIDHEDTGESQVKNALPWDKIRSASFQRVNDLNKQIDQLKAKHQKRIQNEIEFEYINHDIEEYRKLKDTTIISLNEKERIKQREESEQAILKRTNERLKRAGLDPIKTIDDLPKDFEPIDALLIEAAAITLDYAQL